MRSRLGWGLVADLHPTTYELRLGILQSKAEQSGLRIPPKVMEFLAHKITSNVRELEGALNRIACPCAADRARHYAREHPGGAPRFAPVERAAGDDRRNPKAGGRAFQHPAGRDDLGPARSRPSPARVRWRCISPNS